MPSTEIQQLNPALQAGRILAAFAAGNMPLLHQELQRSRTFGCAATPALEQEQFELLRALSEGMLRVGDPVSHGRRDPAVRRCLDLLAHLAQAPAVPSPVRSAYEHSPRVM
jgi:hypothetical protein